MFIRDLLFSHSWLDRLFGLLVSLFFVLVIGLILAVGYEAVDKLNIPSPKIAMVEVRSRYVEPAHPATETYLIGKTLFSRVVQHPETYHVHIQINGTELDICVEQSFFDSVRVGDHIVVNYGQTRLSKKYEVKTVSRVLKPNPEWL